MSFEIIVTDVPDRERLVAEIWLNERMVAEVNQEPDKPYFIEIYRPALRTWEFELEPFLEAVRQARSRLEG